MAAFSVADELRQIGTKLKENFGENFLGSREDRGELSFWVLPAVWIEASALLVQEGFDHLSDLTAVDYLDRDPRFDVMSILSNQESRSYLRLKTVLDEDETLDSLTVLWSGSNWFEREIFDLFGIKFNSHPDQRRILLPEDYKGHPLRKDYPITGPASSVFR